MSVGLSWRVALVFLLLAGGQCVAAQQQGPAYRLQYTIAMPQPQLHLFEVRLEIAADAPLQDVRLQMPRWSPGRYAVFDFAKNVQELRAGAGACAPAAQTCSPLEVERADTQTWRVRAGDARQLTVSYKVFADNLSGTFSQLDERHANFNGASVFLYVVDHKQDPVALRVNVPANWRAVNGRMSSPDQREWQFPNYDELIDTPTEVGPDWTVDEFRVDGKLYRVVVHSLGDEGGRRAALARDLEKIVRAETAMWGAPDFESYTFLIHFAPDNQSGDGMEHLTSTQIIERGALASDGAYQGALETAAHEFFHVWNVKRLRPAELGPWDFTRPLSTRALWIAEGLTNYYGTLVMRRAGLWSDQQLYDAFARTITRIENAPGSRLMSAEDSSTLAPFLDGAPHAQRNNLAATSIDYYPKGETLGLVLDLLLRGRTANRRSLDDVMRRMYETFYLRGAKDSYYLKGRGYTVEDFARAITEMAGAEMQDFFTRHVRGVRPPPYAEALAPAGLRIVQLAPETEKTKRYRIEEIENASTQQRALRSAWLTGRK